MSVASFAKWIKDLNVRLDTIKLVEDNIGKTLFDINHSKLFFDPPLREMEIKKKIYNGEKTASSISGARKTGQLHVKE